ncbi:hypothetical protein [Corynebacterium halotolerans]|nr:hypothetical protein [Corynebacterium halotolerans]
MSSTDHTTTQSSIRGAGSGVLRFAGMVLILSALVGFLGQLLAIGQWRQVGYSFGLNRISDLGLTTCGMVQDLFFPRYACSPGYGWFNIGTIVSGVLLIIGALLLLTGLRRSPDRIRGGSAVAWLLLLSGAALIVTGAVPANVNAVLHDAAGVARAVLTWAAMALVWWAFRSWRRSGAEGPLPLVSGPAARATLVLLIVSVAGFLALVLAGLVEFAAGLVDRLTFDLLGLWTILLGTGLLGLPLTRAREQQRTDERRQLRRERAERDAAVRQAVEGLEQ